MRAANIEQAKLLATAINHVAVAFIVIGFVTPITAASFDLGGVGPLRQDTTIPTLAMRANERAIRRDERLPPDE